MLASTCDVWSKRIVVHVDADRSPALERGGVESVGADLLRVASCDVLAVHAA